MGVGQSIERCGVLTAKTKEEDGVYLLKIIRPGGAEELVPECTRIFKTPLEQPGQWDLKLEFPSPRDPLQLTVPSAEIETIFIMSRHGDTIEILGKKPRPGGSSRHRRNRQQRRQ